MYVNFKFQQAGKIFSAARQIVSRPWYDRWYDVVSTSYAFMVSY